MSQKNIYMHIMQGVVLDMVGNVVISMQEFRWRLDTVLDSSKVKVRLHKKLKNGTCGGAADMRDLSKKREIEISARSTVSTGNHLVVYSSEKQQKGLIEGHLRVPIK